MYAIRCTQKLLDRGAPPPVQSPTAPTTVLGDWYANIIFTRPEQLVICISQKTLLPVVVPAKDIKRLPERVLAAAEAMLTAIGVSSEDVELELDEMQKAVFAKTADRRVLGSLNDFVFHFQHGTGSDKGMTLHERALCLARMPCGALDYAYPTEATLAAFSAGRALKAAMRAA
jgi:hypothetical protein